MNADASMLGREDSLTGLTSMTVMWIIRYSPHSHPVSARFNTYGRFWGDMLHSALHRHHQNIRWGNLLRKRFKRVELCRRDEKHHPSSHTLGECITAFPSTCFFICMFNLHIKTRVATWQSAMETGLADKSWYPWGMWLKHPPRRLIYWREGNQHQESATFLYIDPWDKHKWHLSIRFNHIIFIHLRFDWCSFSSVISSHRHPLQCFTGTLG